MLYLLTLVLVTSTNDYLNIVLNEHTNEVGNGVTSGPLSCDVPIVAVMRTSNDVGVYVIAAHYYLLIFVATADFYRV